MALAKDTLSSKDKFQATVLAARVRDIRLVGDALRPPTPPSRLGDLEVEWRTYRDNYDAFRRRLSSDPDLLALAGQALLGELRDTGWTQETGLSLAINRCWPPQPVWRELMTHYEPEYVVSIEQLFQH